jgi:hypothetical protein
MEGGFFVEGEDEQAPPPAQVSAQPSKPGCTRCSSLSWNQEWLEAFGVRLCNTCKREQPLISKVRAANTVPRQTGGLPVGLVYELLAAAPPASLGLELLAWRAHKGGRRTLLLGWLAAAFPPLLFWRAANHHQAPAPVILSLSMLATC